MFFSPPFVWGLLGVLLIASEMAITGFTIFFFGAGALLTALISAILPTVASNFGAQLLIWAGSSIFSFIFLRKRFAKIFRGTILNRLPGDAEAVGEKVTVLESIEPDKPGRVRYRGTSWQAVSLTESFKEGDLVEVVESSGINLTVTTPFDAVEDGEDFIQRLEEDKEKNQEGI
jgi:inner membrane protein